MSLSRNAAAMFAAAVVLVACGSSGTSKASTPTTGANGSATTAGSTNTTPHDSTPTVSTLPAVDAGKAFPADRCAANKAAGTILYLSSYDFAASASIVDVLVAANKGYYKDLCLDVKLKSSFSTDNYPQIAGDDAQFSSGGSFSELVDYAGANDANDAGYVALAVEGRTGIDALITKDGAVATLADIKGKKIGVKGAITPSVKAMLAKAGLVENKDYTTVLLDGFDPTVHIAVPDIVGFPGFKSNEPKQLDAKGIKYKLFDPSSDGIPGSFGIIYTNSRFMQQFPSAAQDFMRATMKGLADAIADPAGAAKIAVDAINANGNALFLSPAGETARWAVESKLVADGVTADAPLGLPLVDALKAEVSTYASVGLFDGKTPDISTMVDPSVVKSLYDAKGTLIWPS
jgi:ABC-type nitrate/sulfonate/bicarbonate transport system substrate-binding protein